MFHAVCCHSGSNTNLVVIIGVMASNMNPSPSLPLLFPQLSMEKTLSMQVDHFVFTGCGFVFERSPDELVDRLLMIDHPTLELNFICIL